MLNKVEHGVSLGIDKRGMANLFTEISRGNNFQGDVSRSLSSYKDHYKTPYRQLPNLRRGGLCPGHGEDFESR